MLPTTSSFLDSPTKKIKDLVDAAKINYDSNFTLKQYVRSAQALLKKVVTKDKDFNKLKSDSEYLATKQLVIDALDNSEKIKDLLQAKYESLHNIDMQAMQAASNAGKPKPPPRPTKPEFLSASRFDGQAPVSSPPTSNNAIASSSSSAPTTPLPSYEAPSSPNMGPSGLSGSFAAMSIAMPTNTPPLNSQTSYPPPPTSLPGYRPLLPTAYNATTNVSATSAIFGSLQGQHPIQSTLSALPPPPAKSSSSMQNPVSTYSSNASSVIPVPAPRPAHTFAPPTSSPAALANSDSQRQQPNETPSQSSTSAASSVQSPSPTPSSVTSSAPTSSEAQKPTQPLEIKPQNVLNYLRQDNPPKLLFLDVRRQIQYASAKIKAPFIVNIDPLALRPGISSKVIADQSLFDNAPLEQDAFRDRHTFELVIYYDQTTTTIPTSGPLVNLYRALHELEFEKPLKRLPVLLIGGFDAWLECAGMNWVEGVDVDAARRETAAPTMSTPLRSIIGAVSSSSASDPPLTRPGSAPIPQDHQPQSHAIFTKLARGGGINRQEGRIILRTIGDHITHQEGPQSMVNPWNQAKSPPNYVNNNFGAAYPPSATPYSNINATPPPSHMASYTTNNNINHSVGYTNGVQGHYSHGSGHAEYQGQPGYPGEASYGSNVMPNGATYRNETHTLNRRTTVYDNHWNNFGGGQEKPTTMKVTSPPVPDKVPIMGANMDGAMMNNNSYNINSYNNNISPSGPNMHQMPNPNNHHMARPPIPTKPMRPLPQPPGMSDLRSYTQFGSNFSKMGSQLGKTGLTNLGNTCFMNSVIQCLIATPPLSRYFLDGSFKRNINLRNVLGTQGKLAEAFSDLIRQMWSGQSLVVSPTSFRYAIAGFAPQFKGTEQHDSQEFLSFLLDGLHEDLKLEPRPVTPGGEVEGSEADEARMEKLPEFEASEIAWHRYLRRDNSIIVNLFQGQFKNRLCCTKCGKTSTTYNAFMYLALPIKAKVSGRQPQTLASCLNNFVEPETMEGDNAWNCPSCKKPRKATKQLTISRVPDVLLIQLKRFSSDGPFKNKIKAMVQYPIQDLDLTKYLPKRGKNTTEQAIYDLYAVSNHSGEVSSGHYTACVRGEAPGSWTNFDDTRVSPCDKSVAVSEHGYTLFYVRKKL
ncbi:ubiquitin-specific protease doa4 [Podila humilis]|nr:ubiquitin-specific protease doa4 [Podila humilis]